MLRKLSTTASSFAMSVAKKPSALFSSVQADTSRPDPLVDYTPRPGLEYGPGPVNQFHSRKAMYMIVTNVPAIGMVYAQPNTKHFQEYMQTLIMDLASFGESLLEKVNRTLLAIEDIKIGNHYAVRSQEDGNLHRAEAMGFTDGGKVKVFLLDYGNYEIVHPSLLFVMPVDLENRRIHLQCLLMDGVDPIFEEECVGDNSRLEVLKWFRERLEDQVILAATINDGNRCHIYLDRININGEVMQKICALPITRKETKQFDAMTPVTVNEYTNSNPSCTGSDNSVASSRATVNYPVCNSSLKQTREEVQSYLRQTSGPIAPIAEEEIVSMKSSCQSPVANTSSAVPSPTISTSIRSSKSSINSSASEISLIGDGFNLVQRTQKSILKERKNQIRKDMGLLLFKLENYIQTGTLKDQSKDMKCVKDLKEVEDKLHGTLEKHNSKLRRLNKDDGFWRTYEDLKKNNCELLDVVKVCVRKSNETAYGEIAEIRGAWDAYKVKAMKSNIKKREFVSDQTLLEIIKRYQEWIDETEHELLDASVNSQKCLNDFCSFFSSELEKLVRDDSVSVNGEEDEDMNEKEKFKASQRLQEDMQRFSDAVEAEKDLIKKHREPPFAEELYEILETFVCDIAAVEED